MNAFTINLPPLRERTEEIPLLLKHFMSRFAGRYARTPLSFSPALLEACLRHRWPGNLRELENFVKRYLILGDESMVFGEITPSITGSTMDVSVKASDKPPDLKSLVRSLKDEAEMEAIARALETTNWSRKEAARLLNISYKALLYKMRSTASDRRPTPARQILASPNLEKSLSSETVIFLLAPPASLRQASPPRCQSITKEGFILQVLSSDINWYGLGRLPES